MVLFYNCIILFGFSVHLKVVENGFHWTSIYEPMFVYTQGTVHMYAPLMDATRNLPSQLISNLTSSHMPRPSKLYCCQWVNDFQ